MIETIEKIFDLLSTSLGQGVAGGVVCVMLTGLAAKWVFEYRANRLDAKADQALKAEEQKAAAEDSKRDDVYASQRIQLKREELMAADLKHAREQLLATQRLADERAVKLDACLDSRAELIAGIKDARREKRRAETERDVAQRTVESSLGLEAASEALIKGLAEASSGADTEGKGGADGDD